MLCILVLATVTCTTDSIRAIASLGYNTDSKVVETIKRKAVKYDIRPDLMVSIAILESGLKPKAYRVNSNGTVDHGIFQINSVNSQFCKGLNIHTLEGNVECAAKLLALHKHKKNIDSMWYCRYHSKTPSRKLEYCNKLNEIRSKYAWEMKTLTLAQTN